MDRILKSLLLAATVVFFVVSCGADPGGGIDSEGNFVELKEKNVVFNSNGATKTASPTSLNYVGITAKNIEVIYQFTKEVAGENDGNGGTVTGIVGATEAEIEAWAKDDDGNPVPADGFALNSDWEAPGIDLLGWQAKRAFSITKDYPQPEDPDDLTNPDNQFTHTKFNGESESFWLVDQLPADPSKLNYKFNGWNISKDGTGPAVTIGTKLTKQKMTVFAQWIPDEKNQIQFTGGVVPYKITEPGFYQVELWGAQGWNPDSDTASKYGGRGAYTRGIYYVSEQDIAEGSDWNTFYIAIAKRGIGAKDSYNGAGLNWTGNPARDTDEGAGGGASDIRWGGASIYDRIQVSGGGGGANDAAKTGHGGAIGVSFQKGGWGGVLEGAHSNYGEGQNDPGIGGSQGPRGRGTQPATTTVEEDWTISGNYGQWSSRPVNQTGQGAPYDYTNTAERIYQGRFFQGGYYLGVSESAGGGGGGWYGGYSGGQSWHNGGGGGGSSFIVGIKGFVGIASKLAENVYENPPSRWDETSNLDGAATDKTEITLYETVDGIEVPHIIEIYRGTDAKATSYLGGNDKVAVGNTVINKTFDNENLKIYNRRAIPKLVLFKGEEGEKEYTTTAIAGNKEMPSPSGGKEVGHIGLGFGRITLLGDGVAHEVFEVVEPDVDEDVPPAEETGEEGE